MLDESGNLRQLDRRHPGSAPGWFLQTRGGLVLTAVALFAVDFLVVGVVVAL